MICIGMPQVEILCVRLRMNLIFSSLSADVDGGSRAVRKLAASLSDTVLFKV